MHRAKGIHTEWLSYIWSSVYPMWLVLFMHWSSVTLWSQGRTLDQWFASWVDWGSPRSVCVSVWVCVCVSESVSVCLSFFFPLMEALPYEWSPAMIIMSMIQSSGDSFSPFYLPLPMEYNERLPTAASNMNTYTNAVICSVSYSCVHSCVLSFSLFSSLFFLSPFTLFAYTGWHIHKQSLSHSLNPCVCVCICLCPLLYLSFSLSVYSCLLVGCLWSNLSNCSWILLLLLVLLVLAWMWLCLLLLQQCEW